MPGADSIRFYGNIYRVDTSAQLGSKNVDINYCSPINNRIISLSNFYISSVSLKSGGLNNVAYNPLVSNYVERPLVGYWDYTDSTNTNQVAVEKRGTKDTLFVRAGGWLGPWEALVLLGIKVHCLPWWIGIMTGCLAIPAMG